MPERDLSRREMITKIEDAALKGLSSNTTFNSQATVEAFAGALSAIARVRIADAMEEANRQRRQLFTGETETTLKDLSKTSRVYISPDLDGPDIPADQDPRSMQNTPPSTGL